MEGMKEMDVFRWSGETEKERIHAYTECGLENIFLVNGYVLRHHDGDEYVSVQDVEGLHRAISKHLVLHRKGLNGREIRFIRKTMNLTQKELADKLGNDSQTVARWEKGERNIPGASDKLLRAIMLAEVAQTDEDRRQIQDMLISILDDLDNMDSAYDEQAQFRFDDQWLEAA